MRASPLTLLFTIAVLFSSASIAAQKENSQDQIHSMRNEIEQLQSSAKSLTGDIEILRRDQINYRIEKDLLKDAYSSNLETINLVIAISLGIGGVIGWLLGYFGIKNLRAVKADFEAELNTLTQLRTSFDNDLNEAKQRLKSLETTKNEFESKLGTLNSVNEDQSRRLRVLEIIEKVNNLMRQNSWEWALEHTSIGLSLDPTNTLLLHQKSLLHGKLGQFQEAINSIQKSLENDGAQHSDVEFVNLLEYLALTNQQVEFDRCYSKYKDVIDRKYDGYAIKYLNVTRKLISGELEQGIDFLRNYAMPLQGTKATKLLGDSWTMDEMHVLTSKLPASRQKDLLNLTSSFFSGEATADDVLKALN